MMMIVALATLAFGAISCDINVGQNSDLRPTQVTKAGQKFVLTAFDEISMSCPFEVDYEPGGSPAVLLEAPDDVFQYITVYVKDSTLHVATNNSIVNGGIDLDFSKVKLHVMCPQLKDIEVKGSGDFVAKKAIKAEEDFEIELAGSGNIKLMLLTCHDLDIQVAGSGKVTVGAVNCNDIETSIAGSGSVVCMQVKANEVETNIAGSGKARFYGHAASHKENVTGSGRVDVSELK